MLKCIEMPRLSPYLDLLKAAAPAYATVCLANQRLRSDSHFLTPWSAVDAPPASPGYPHSGNAPWPSVSLPVTPRGHPVEAKGAREVSVRWHVKDCGPP